MTPRAPPTPSLILHKFSLFRQPPPARSYPPRPILLQFAGQFLFPIIPASLRYQNSPSHIHIAAIQPTSSLYQPSPLQTLDSIDSRVNSYPFLPYFIHQLTSIDPATPIVPVCCRVPPPQDATIDHCPNSIPPFQSAPCYPSLSPIHTPLPETHQKCLQRDGPSPYASQKRA
ncbi:hypothetical protein PAPYR_11082 [Paratrimastix pyriformis]|uniref:Uncharacterized protein n=1 Tax=Paratrimastix pyriformis TaxID=342808 RepID=A0ABQ8U8T2_9EUKA|nr:hypothetical protein PAPYR_11082 [Paratrimastix pyriformis]